MKIERTLSHLTLPESTRARRAGRFVNRLQDRLVQAMEAVCVPHDDDGFSPIDWLRDDGQHGGGRRYAIAKSPNFNRASVNISTVHYDDLPDKRLRSATALSAIIHPDHPRAPSFHMHISWTDLRDNTSYWRLMADLNPCLKAPRFKARFDKMLQSTTGDYFDEGCAQGDRYFYIPALKRHRGVSHFYLEGYDTGDFDNDLEFADQFGSAVIDCYAGIVAESLDDHRPPTADQRARQLAYHTVYFFQVLTLDRGTTSGLLVHDQNDVGILASLPSFVDRDRLISWRENVPHPQDELLDDLVDTLPDVHPCPVTDDARSALADVIRRHYDSHPEALKFQARGDRIPPTVDNHRADSQHRSDVAP